MVSGGVGSRGMGLSVGLRLKCVLEFGLMPRWRVWLNHGNGSLTDELASLWCCL
jgi:hypothetical protein